MEFRERIILVTGAAGGIGRVLSSRIGREGGHLGLIDRNAEALADLRNELVSAGVPCAAAVAAVGDRDQLRTAIEEIARQLGAVDILIAAAGICRTSSAENLRIGDLEEIFRANVFGIAFAVEAVLPAMLARRSGQIAAILSLAAICPLPSESTYSASKAAAASYLQSLRPRLREQGIRVTSIFPGFVKTPLLDGLQMKRVPPSTMTADQAAEKIVTAIRSNKSVLLYPGAASWPARIAACLPPAAFDWIMTRSFVTKHLPA